MKRKLIGVSTAVTVLIAVGPMLWVQVMGQSGIVKAVDVTSTPVAVVFGAGLRPDGSPSAYLTRRLDAARDLYEKGLVDAILVSGDNGRTSHDEPTAMRDWLVDHGVPTDQVILDFAGFDTHDTCVRAATVFGVEEAVLITQDYHLPRAMYSCSMAGIDVQGVGVTSEGALFEDRVIWRFREWPASWKAWWDAITHRSAKFPGPQETTLQDALEG